MWKIYLKLLFYTCLLACSIYLAGIKAFYLSFLVLARNPQTEPFTKEIIDKYILPDTVTVGFSLIIFCLSVYKLKVNIKRFLTKRPFCHLIDLITFLLLQYFRFLLLNTDIAHERLSKPYISKWILPLPLVRFVELRFEKS